MVAATVAGITYPWHSVGSPPERLLQAVNVNIGSDGRIVGVTATDVHRTAKKSSHDKVGFDPHAVPPLPVRLEVGYVMDGHVGHDLKDVAGKSGTIEVDVTVTNATQHTQLVSYNDAAGTHQQSVQVAAPVTVVGTATLPKDSFTGLQTPAPDLRESGDNTGRVVSSTADGDTAVQWATVLAPPRLAASTTFRLVVTTTNFVMPSFTVAAQPGLVTDPSTAQLLAAAFAGGTGTDAAQLVDVERDTVSQIGGLQRQLADTSGQVAAVANTLAGPASQLGRQAVGRLASANTELRARSAALATSLRRLDTSMTDTLGTAKTPAKQQLDSAMKVVVDYIGVGAVKEPAPARLSRDCSADEVNKVAQPKTLLGELGLVTGQVRSLGSSTTRCASALSAELDDVIGPADAKDCTPTSRALVCDLASTSTALGALSENIDAAQGQILAHLDPSFQATVADDIGKLAKAVTTAQGGVAAINPSSGAASARKLAHEVTSAQAQVQTALSVLTARTGGVASHLQSVHDQANQALSAIATLSPAGGSSSIADQIAELDNRICNTPSDMNSGLDRDYVAVLNALVSGGGCGGTLGSSATDPVFGTPLSVRISTLRANLSSVLAQTDSTSGSGLAADFAPIKDRLSGISSSLGSIAAELGKHAANTGTIAQNLAAVVNDLDSLYDAKATAASCTSSSTATLPLNVLTEDFKALTCQTDAGVADVKALLGHLPSAHQKARGSVGSGSGSSVGSGSSGGSKAAQVPGATISSLIDGLSSALRASGVRPVAVDADLRQGIAAIDTSIGSALDLQPASAANLRELAAMVLNYLGDGATSVASVTAADPSDATPLVRAQIRQGIRQAQGLSAFGTQQPGGSSHVSVYVFAVNGS